MRWLRHLVRMPPGCLPGEVFRAPRRPPGKPETSWGDCVSWLAWERFEIPRGFLTDASVEDEEMLVLVGNGRLKK